MEEGEWKRQEFLIFFCLYLQYKKVHLRFTFRQINPWTKGTLWKLLTCLNQLSIPGKHLRTTSEPRNVSVKGFTRVTAVLDNSNKNQTKGRICENVKDPRIKIRYVPTQIKAHLFSVQCWSLILPIRKIVYDQASEVIKRKICWKMSEG